MTSDSAKPPRTQRRFQQKGLNPRTAARLASVQALYQMDIAGTDANEVVQQFKAHRFAAAEVDDPLSKSDPVFFAELVRGVVRRQRDIDPPIDQQLATGWRLVRVDSTLRAILRSAAYELLERHDVPARVVINEYINVAHAFFDEDEPRVVNGVLDKIARNFRPSEFTDRPAKAAAEPPAGAVDEPAGPAPGADAARTEES